MNYYALISAILFGLLYASTEQIVKFIDIKTYLIIYCLFSLVFLTTIGLIDNSLIKDATNSEIPFFYILVSCISGLVASFLSIYAMKQTNAVNVAILEITYPIYTLLFVYLITGKNHLTLNILFGGLLIGAGTLIVVLEKK